MDIKVEKLEHDDLLKFTELIHVFEEVFEMKNFKLPETEHLEQLLRKDDFFLFVALLENKVVGGLTSYIFHQYYSVSPLVYIFDLAVKTEFQYKGIGKILIAANNDYCKSIQAEAVMVEADEADDYAIEFYRSTGATALKVVHFDYNLKDK